MSLAHMNGRTNGPLLKSSPKLTSSSSVSSPPPFNEQSIKSIRSIKSNNSTIINLSSSSSSSTTTTTTTPFQYKYHMFNRKNSFQQSKLFRILTVIAYIIAVSMSAIVLSIYYTFIWNPYQINLNNRNVPHDDNQLTQQQHLMHQSNTNTNQTF